jgi:preprotein translocase subunit Sss1
MLTWVVATVVALANLGVLWVVNEAARRPTPAEFSRCARRAARLFWLIVISSLVGFAINLLLGLARSHAARAAPGAFVASSVVHALAFALFGGLYPGGAALWLGRQARRR